MVAYIAEKLDRGHVIAKSPEHAGLAGAIRWAIDRGDGSYLAGELSPWGGVSGDGLDFEVEGGTIKLPDRTDWERIVHASAMHRRAAGRAVPSRVLLHVIEPGQLSKEGLFREPGTCLSRGPLPGDTILDVLTVEVGEDRLEVRSRRRQETRYEWTDDGPRFNRERRSVARVSISGRASGWGRLGDDSYDPGSADAILREILIEAVLGSGEWKIAPIYYEVVEVSDEREDGDDPIVTVPLRDFRASDYEDYVFRPLLESSRAADRIPLDILEAGDA